MLWNAAYQIDLNKSAGQKQRKAFISHQIDNSDESDHECEEDNLSDSEEDNPSPYSVFQSSFNSPETHQSFHSLPALGRFPRGTQADDYQLQQKDQGSKSKTTIQWWQQEAKTYFGTI